MLKIVPAGKNDIDVIRELTLEVWPPTYDPIIGKQQVAYMLGLFYTPEALAKQMDGGHQFVLGYWNDHPVAFASYGPIGDRLYKLHKLYILPDMQGNGIGRDIVNYIAADISDKATGLRLNVNIHNTPAKNFYARVGFNVIYDEDIDIGGGFFMNDHVLELPIH